MKKSWKLKDFTVPEFQQLLIKHNKDLDAIAREKLVSKRAIQRWVSINCPRRIVYGCCEQAAD